MTVTDSTEECPPGFMPDETAGIRSCGRPNGGASCLTIMFPSNGISYSEVCGRVVDHQYGRPDAAYLSSIDSYYIDGVSITQGYLCKHIWSLIAGSYQSLQYSWNCPCSTQPVLNHHHHLLMMITSASLIILITIGHTYLIQLILSGMVKGVVLRRQTIVQLLVSHCFTEPLTPLLITLN